MKRVLECGDVELSNDLSEQMMRSIKMNLFDKSRAESSVLEKSGVCNMNLKNTGNIGSERGGQKQCVHVLGHQEQQDVRTFS